MFQGEEVVYPVFLNHTYLEPWQLFWQRVPFKEKWMLPLIGLIYGGMIGAVAEMIASRFNLVQSMTSWTQGSFAMIQTNQYEWLFLNLILA